MLLNCMIKGDKGSYAAFEERKTLLVQKDILAKISKVSYMHFITLLLVNLQGKSCHNKDSVRVSINATNTEYHNEDN